jgi:hypothetical protein
MEIGQKLMGFQKYKFNINKESFMSRNLMFLGITILCVAFLLIAGFQGNEPAAQEAANSADMLKRGEYLVTIGLCHDCHTPKKYGP